MTIFRHFVFTAFIVLMAAITVSAVSVPNKAFAHGDNHDVNISRSINAGIIKQINSNKNSNKAVLSGILDVTHVDDFDNPDASYYKYTLHVKKGAGKSEDVAVYPNHDIPAQSGTKVTISGSQLENTLAVNTDDAHNLVIVQTPASDATGTQRTIVMLVDYTDSGTRPFTKTQAETILNNSQFKVFYTEESYSNVSWTTDVADWVKLNKNGDTMICNNLYDTDIEQIVNARSINLANYDRIAILISHPNIGGGCSNVGKSGHYVNGVLYNISVSLMSLRDYSLPSNYGAQPFPWTNLDYLLSHEMGHGLGMLHAHGLACDDVIGQACSFFEYGNYFDTMGSNGYSLHSNAYYKDQMGWLPQSRQLTITQSGRYTINNLESQTGVVSAKISIGTSTPYYLEYRRPVGFDSNLNSPMFSNIKNGLMVNKITYLGPAIVDVTPSTLDWGDDTRDAVILPNASWSDPSYALAIRTVSNTATSITFDVHIGPGVLPPLVDDGGSSSGF